MNELFQLNIMDDELAYGEFRLICFFLSQEFRASDENHTQIAITRKKIQNYIIVIMAIIIDASIYTYFYFSFGCHFMIIQIILPNVNVPTFFRVR